MNDFTKEELKFITMALDRYAIKDCYLDKKIQSMIDNYCDHEKGGIEHIEFMDICKKCRRPW